MEFDKELAIDVIDAVEVWFTTKFGTYTENDTVKIKDIFKILNEIKELISEG